MNRCVVAFLLLSAVGFPVHAAMNDDQFLDDLEHHSFRFFWDEANPTNGLVPDRANADGKGASAVASIASVGFGLTAICIGDQRGWVDHDAACQRVLTTLRFFRDKAPQDHGFYYHFLNMNTGAREWNCELSSIDTALLMAGVLTVRQYFHGTEAAALATELYERVDWPWMLNGGQTLSMGWTPEHGFLDLRWSDYSEHLILYLMGIGSPTHPLPAECWHAWRREPIVTYDGKTFLQRQPLFAHQYSQAWVDFRDKRDAYADYWRNSVLATLAHRQFCIDLHEKFPGYRENLWGITSSDSADGYKGWGGPPATTQPPIDGTVVPCAAGGSVPFAPRECLAVLRHMRDAYGDRIWKKYGFVDAFNPQTKWVGADVIGIDVGITLVMAENQRSGFVWNWFMRNSEISHALEWAGFHSTASALSAADQQYLRELAHDTWRSIETLVEPTTGLPYDNAHRGEFTSVSNIGLYLTDIVAARDLKLISEQTAEDRLSPALDSLKKLRTTFGFQQCWNSVRTLQPGTNDTWVSVVDSGNLAGGLITVGNAFPKFRNDCRQLVEAMDWGKFYNAKRNVLVGGYNNATQKFNPDWTMPFLGADSRLASFLAVASGEVPPQSWTALMREMEEREHVRYLKPGWQGGGLFMQYINGLWLDDRDTFMGQSARNFAYAQIEYARTNHFPVWGWSASDSPGGKYLGWGGLRDNVVTPHASALALADFPEEAVANLRALERRGARSRHFGFVDAIDISSGRIADNYLMLDQSMLFLSLANYLDHGTVRHWFQSDPMVQRGRQLIADYRQPSYGTNISIFTLNGPPKDLKLAPQKTAVARRYDEWKDADWQMMDSSNALESGVVTPETEAHAKFAFEWTDDALYFTMQVVAHHIVNDRQPEKIHEQDSVELFIDPQNDGLRWGNAADFQFGFAPTDKLWEWFGQRRCVTATTKTNETGYVVQAVIPWTVLGVRPGSGAVLQVSPAVNSVDGKSGPAMKLNWNWQPMSDTVRLGSLTLQ